MGGGAVKGVLSSWYSKWGTREGREGLQAAYLLFCGLAENHCLVFRYSEALEIFSSILISNSNIINPTIVKNILCMIFAFRGTCFMAHNITIWLGFLFQ